LTDLEKVLAQQFVNQEQTTSGIATAMVMKQRWFGGDFE
jgi:hypothetical protein